MISRSGPATLAARTALPLALAAVAPFASLGAFASLASCTQSSSPVPATAQAAVHRTDPAAVHVAGKWFRDGQGRHLLFRGYNAKATTLFDVTFPDGRTANETFQDLDEAAAARVEQLGWNVLRIPVSWSGLEPHPLDYSAAFLAKLDAVVALAAAHHFYVFIDMHQDGYSKEIGEDGQPLWAIEPPPKVLLQGPYDDARRLQQPALQAGWSFFANASAADGRPLQDAYVAAVQQIVTHLIGRPEVLGYEAFNEPVVLSNTELDAFHARFADAVHALDLDAPVMFEPSGTRNQFDSAVIPGSPWSHGPGVYAIHTYTCWFSTCSPNGWTTMDPAALSPSWQHAELERAGWGTPLFVTEFGTDQTMAVGPAWMSAELDLQDQYLASSTAWEYSGRGNWGFFGSDGQEHPATTHIMARMFPRAVAGTILKIARPKPGDMIVTYQADAATNGLPHEVSLSADYVTGATITCDGATPKDDTRATGRATFTCPLADSGVHTFEVVGTPVQ